MSILTSLVQSHRFEASPQRRKLLVCCSVSIRYSTITVCIVGHPFGHGWAVVVISAREVKSASSGRVEKSNLPQTDRCFLFIDFEGSSYIGCLLCSDHIFCSQIVRILQVHLNKTIAQIGSIDLTHTSLGARTNENRDTRRPSDLTSIPVF